MIGQKERAHLERHFHELVANKDWLRDCLTGKSNQFPYQVEKDGDASIDRLIFQKNLKNTPTGDLNGRPAYLVNIPCAGADVQRVNHLIKLFETESYGTTRAQAKQFAESRMIAVIGTNAPLSIDPAKNREFADNFDQIKVTTSAAVRVIKFHWTPEWVSKCSIEHLLEKERAYFLLKMLKPNIARKVLDRNEGVERMSEVLKSQIPYQKIRDTIRSFSTPLASHLERVFPQSPIYYGTMDADTVSLQREERLFSSLDQAIQDAASPAVIGCGYMVSDDELPLIRLAIKLDMVVRAAMTAVIPYSAYLPEPSTFFCIRHAPTSHILNELSFLGTGNRLENKRLIQNARLRKLFNDTVVFLPLSGVIMQTPGRMKTEKNGKVEDLTTYLLKQRQYLESLRGLSQTHIFPKQWAENLYSALGFKASRVTDVTQHFMAILGVFDPIARAFSGAYNNASRFTNKTLENVLTSYNDPLPQHLKDLLKDSKQHLKDQNLPDDKIQLVVKAARESGKAIYQVLADELGICLDDD